MKILFENGDFVIIEKPQNVSSEPDGSGKDALTLTEAETKTKCFLVHRLDRGTGGCMIIAKNAKSAASLSEMMRDHLIKKEYLAIVEGEPAEKSGTFSDLLYHDARKNKSFVVKRERRGVKKAVLDYEVVGSSEGKTLVRALLHTGRTHQIRIQFASRKMPLVGDRRYGSRTNAPFPALWSTRITVPGIVTAESIPGWDELSAFKADE